MNGEKISFKCLNVEHGLFKAQFQHMLGGNNNISQSLHSREKTSI
jgi:hypothetical protein